MTVFDLASTFGQGPFLVTYYYICSRPVLPNTVITGYTEYLEYTKSEPRLTLNENTHQNVKTSAIIFILITS